MSVYKVYIENHAVVFATPSEAGSAEPGFEVGPAEAVPITKLLQKLQFTKKLTVISEEIDRVFDNFCASLPFIEAGGGLVADPSGCVLMIFRNGRWDLPKGKREFGERIEQCAVREVSEECALPESGLSLGDKITDTFHCYRLRDEWVLKRTSWYHMRYGGKAVPSPQTVEGITRVEWIGSGRVPELLRDTYYTIGDVFRAAGYAF